MTQDELEALRFRWLVCKGKREAMQKEMNNIRHEIRAEEKRIREANKKDPLDKYRFEPHKCKGCDKIIEWPRPEIFEDVVVAYYGKSEKHKYFLASLKRQEYCCYGCKTGGKWHSVFCRCQEGYELYIEWSKEQKENK